MLHRKALEMARYSAVFPIEIHLISQDNPPRARCRYAWTISITNVEQVFVPDIKN